MAELTAAFEAYLSPHNANPNLLVSIKSAKVILQKFSTRTSSKLEIREASVKFETLVSFGGSECTTNREKETDAKVGEPGGGRYVAPR